MSEQLTHPRSDRFFEVVAGGLAKVLKVTATGEQIEKPEIIIPNHFRYSEVVVQGIAAWRNAGRPPSFLGNHYLFLPPHGFMFRRIGGIPVRVKNPDREFVADNIKIARDDGRCTVIYPEGGFHKDDPDKTVVDVAPIKSGALHYARDMEMALRPAGTVMIDRKHNVVHYGEAFDPSDMSKEEVRERIQSAVDAAVVDAKEMWGYEPPTR